MNKFVFRLKQWQMVLPVCAI